MKKSLLFVSIFSVVAMLSQSSFAATKQNLHKGGFLTGGKTVSLQHGKLVTSKGKSGTVHKREVKSVTKKTSL